MSAANKAALIKKIHRTLKAAYPKFQLPIKDRPLAEHILYACCLENSTSDQASEAFGKLQTLYIEWNEIRVSSTKELAEVMDCLTDPAMPLTESDVHCITFMNRFMAMTLIF